MLVGLDVVAQEGVVRLDYTVNQYRVDLRIRADHSSLMSIEDTHDIFFLFLDSLERSLAHSLHVKLFPLREIFSGIQS